MPPRTTRWTLLRLAKLAGVAVKVAYEARDRQVLHPDILGPSDALPLRTFDALRRVSWPTEQRGRATRQAVRLWESIAIEKSRMDLNDVGHATGMYVHPQGAELAIKPSDHAVMALRLAEAHVPHLYLPIGHWASQTLVRLVELSDDGEPAAGDDETPRDAKA